MTKVVNHTIIDCNIVKSQYYLKIKNKGYNLLKTNHTEMKYPNIYIPADKQHYIYTNNGYLLYSSKYKHEIIMVELLIEKIYNNKTTLMKLYKYEKNNIYYIFCIYNELLNSFIEENNLIEFKRLNKIFLSITNNCREDEDFKITNILNSKDNINYYVEL